MITCNRIKDPLFWAKKRLGCNCGSYALNIDSWFIPYDEDEYPALDREDFIASLYASGNDVNSIMDILLEGDVEGILEQCPWIEQTSKEEINDDDIVVAYRLALTIEDWNPDEDADIFQADYIDTDFHFRIRRNGVWEEKCGNTPITRCKEQVWEEFEKPWDTGWGVIYRSTILYFRYKQEI